MSELEQIKDGAESITSIVRLMDDELREKQLREKPLGAVLPKLTHSLKLDTRGNRA
jgi:hypothetical protein